jgi:hypothetical protein
VRAEARVEPHADWKAEIIVPWLPSTEQQNLPADSAVLMEGKISARTSHAQDCVHLRAMFHDKKWNGAPELGQDL